MSASNRRVTYIGTLMTVLEPRSVGSGFLPVNGWFQMIQAEIMCQHLERSRSTRKISVLRYTLTSLNAQSCPVLWVLIFLSVIQIWKNIPMS